ARIAIDHAISERTVNRMRDRERWARRSERVRDVAPAMQALREATALLAARARDGGTALGGAPSNNASGSAQPPDPSPPLASLTGGGEPRPPSQQSMIERIERLVERELEAEEAARARLGPLPRAPADAERCARTLATLTQTLHALARLRSGLLPDNGLPDDDMPRDIDEFRRELARRIRVFIESRTARNVGGGGTAHRDVAGEP